MLFFLETEISLILKIFFFFLSTDDPLVLFSTMSNYIIKNKKERDLLLCKYIDLLYLVLCCSFSVPLTNIAK